MDSMTIELTQKLDLKLTDLKIKRDCHNAMVKICNIYNRIFDLPGIVLGGLGFVTACINAIGNIEALNSTIIGLTGIATLLQSIKKYNDYDTKITMHKDASKAYSQIINITESNILNLDGNYSTIKNLYQEVLTRLSVMDEQRDNLIYDSILSEIKNTFPANKAIDIFRNSNELKRKTNSIFHKINMTPVLFPKQRPEKLVDSDIQEDLVSSVSNNTNIEELLDKVDTIMEKEERKAELFDEAKQMIKHATGQTVSHIRNPSRDFMSKLTDTKDMLISIKQKHIV